MTDLTVERSQRMKARIAGGLYLIVIVGGLFAQMIVRGRLVVPGDAGATAYNILTHDLLFRLGFAVEVFYCACNVPLTFIFYDLFKVVNKSITLLVVFFCLVATGIESVSLLGHFAPIILLSGGSYLSAFTANQLQAAAYLSLQLFQSGFAITLVFFGFYCLALGYLVYRSTFLPRFIGVLLAIEGLCYLINSFAYFLAPAFEARFFPFLAVSAVAEISLCLWLLGMGVNGRLWMKQASAVVGGI
jgi:uncharacterized protein DUF4386